MPMACRSSSAAASTPASILTIWRSAMESRTSGAHPVGRSAVSNHKAMAYICTMRVWHNARLLTPTPTDRGVVVAEGTRIMYAGPADDAPRFDGAERIDCEGRWITAGL